MASLREIAAKAAEVRSLQKAYFKDRSQTNLIASKTAEGELDKMLASMPEPAPLLEWTEDFGMWESGAYAIYAEEGKFKLWWGIACYGDFDTLELAKQAAQDHADLRHSWRGK